VPYISASKGDQPLNANMGQPVGVSSERFELLVQSVTDYAIYLLEPDGMIASWNAGAERLKGYAEQEVVGQHFSRFFTPEDRAANKPESALKTALTAGRWEDEGWRVRKDGTRFWALAVLDAVYDKAGRLIGFVKITRDMTERRLAQQALAESERRFRLLVESVVDYALFTLDLAGNIRSWNPGAERLKGYVADEIIGRHFSIFYTEEARAAGEPAAVLAKASSAGGFEGEGWRLRKDGSRFWANVVIDPIRDEKGELIGFTKITRDITERRSLEQAKEQLHQAQKMETVGQLTGGVAHDFNNLLTAVSGSHALLRPMIADPRAQRLLDTAERAVARGAKLTQQLLAFSRQHRLRPEKANANELIAASEGLLRHATGELAELTLDLEPGLWLSNIDQTQFQSALLNLIVNARDASEETGGQITIETRNVELDQARAKALGEICAGHYVMIAVSDRGKGMTAETKARAIEPFFTTKDPGRGSGLGLSQVYGFARQSNGQIEIDSTVGSGTTVRLFLPTHPEQDAAINGSAETVRRAGTVLITEDDPDVLAIAVETLRALGYEVYSAANASEALTILQRGTPVDVLFSDIVMPGGMNGVELAREARRLRPGISVLLASGYSRPGIQPEEGTNFIPKPYQMPELARRLEALLPRPRPAA
jgi:PAS domain S-box-containing protein